MRITESQLKQIVRKCINENYESYYNDYQNNQLQQVKANNEAYARCFAGLGNTLIKLSQRITNSEPEKGVQLIKYISNLLRNYMDIYQTY